MTTATSDWKILGSVEGGECLYSVIDGGVRVAYPEDVDLQKVRVMLEDKEILVGDDVTVSPGESEGEAIAFFA